MQLGMQITEQEYRGLPYPSYSLLSGLSKDGPIAIYGKKTDISDLDSIIIGSIVDAMVTEGGPPPNMVVIDKKPSNKALAIIKALVNRTDLGSGYLLSVKNKKHIEEECNLLDYYPRANITQRMKHLKKYNKYVKALSKFGEEAMIVSSYQFAEATALTNSLFSRFPMLGDPDIIGQVKIVGEVNGIEIKGMLDFIHVDHVNKEITPYDLKTGMGVHHDFFEKGFLNWGYYIQSSLYKELLTQHLKNNVTPISDYKVNNFRFMYCGRTDRLPIIYKVTNKWHDAGLNGFTLENKKYSGVYELLDNYIYYIENPNARYRKGYDTEEVDFKDSLCDVLYEDGK